MVRNGEFDAAIVFSSSMAQYVEDAAQLPRIMHFCDVDSQKWSDLADQSCGLRRWLYRREARLLLDYERRIAARFDASAVVTEHETEVFRGRIPGVPVHVLENGVDGAYFGALPRVVSGLEFLFVGVMDYPPNIEAVVHFAGAVWPEVVKKHPAARFTIVGSRPARAVRSLARQPEITVTGHVPDVRPYLARATMLVAPLGVARGVQNKILEAMAAGIPVLTTPAVIAGLPGGASELVFMAAPDGTAFSARLLELLRNPQIMCDRAAEASEFVRTHCSWKNRLQKLDLLLEEVCRAHRAMQNRVSTAQAHPI
jgi:sugar transferase (PEP-CTERM/EpsH1 system associated)